MANTAQLNTIKDFVLRVAEMEDISDAYNVFEYECTDELQDKIYGFSSNISEPLRSAIHFLGFTDY